MELREAIRHSYVAQGLTDAQLEQIYAIAEMRRYEDGEALTQQSDTTRDLLILATGRANVLTITGEVIGVVRPGMPIGEISFIDDKPRSVSVVCTGGCEAVVLPADRLWTILRDQPDIALRALLNISRVLCARLRSANRNIAALMAVEESDGMPPRSRV